jgi:acyl phosphate:glycerol-3-phosphate acyltransferase
MSASTVFFSITIAYCIGSISSAVIMSKLFNLPDPREKGSKNPGTTNILRLAGKKYAAVVLLIDMLKGAIPVLLGKAMHLEPNALAWTGLFAVIGHIFPVFFGFKGGKGVATAIGSLLAIHFMLGISVIAIWLLVVAFMQYASLASLIAISASPILSLFTDRTAIFMPLLLLAFFVIFKHRENIIKLSEGRESKIHIKRSVLQDILSDKQEIIPPHPGAENLTEEKKVKRKTKRGR